MDTARPSAAAPTAASGDNRTIGLEVGGHARSLILHTPTRAPTSPAPLILVFHGADDTAEATRKETDFVDVADRDGLFVAFLQGYENTWNEGAGHTPAEQAGIDDVAFVGAALSKVERLVPVDPTRVAAVGFSNGALMTEYLGCTLADRLSLIVPVAGPLPVSVAGRCAPSRPLSVLAIHGTADTSIPYAGGAFAGVGGGTTVLSAEDSIGRWATLNGCSPQPTQSSPSSGVRVTGYRDCRSGVSISLRSLLGAGHSWPNDIGDIVANALKSL